MTDTFYFIQSIMGYGGWNCGIFYRLLPSEKVAQEHTLTCFKFFFLWELLPTDINISRFSNIFQVPFSLEDMKIVVGGLNISS